MFRALKRNFTTIVRFCVTQPHHQYLVNKIRTLEFVDVDPLGRTTKVIDNNDNVAEYDYRKLAELRRIIYPDDLICQRWGKTFSITPRYVGAKAFEEQSTNEIKSGAMI